ncbi:MAG: HigA family addiction module antitoxin [Vicinamibacterales bacterium]
MKSAATTTIRDVGRLLPTHRPPTHLGEMLLEEFLKPLGITQADAAARLGVPFQRVNGLVRGRRGVTADTALRLAALTGMDPGFWMGLQADFDLWHALRNVDLSKIPPLKKSA